MGALLVYILKAALCLVWLYLPYVLWLRKETRHNLNRSVLLGILWASFLFPALNGEWLGWDTSLQTSVSDAVYMMLPANPEQVEGGISAADTARDTVPPMSLILVAVYVAGVMVALLVRLFQFDRMRRFIPSGCIWKECREDGITVYCHAGNLSPFSWMRSVVVSDEDVDGERENAVLLHEEAHVRYRHSYDMLLLFAAEALMWFNPVIWLLEKDMRCIHEYQADEYVLEHGVNERNYQLYLIKKAVGSRLQSFANGLNQSTLKKRIAMMCNKKSNKWAACRYLCLLPAGAMALMSFARPEVVNSMDGQLEEIAAVKVTDLSGIVKAASAKNQAVQQEERSVGKQEVADTPAVSGENTKVASVYDRREEQFPAVVTVGTSKGNGISKVTVEPAVSTRDTVYRNVDVRPEFPGGDVALFKFLADKIHYPDSCIANGIKGRVMVNFIVYKDGSLSGVKIIRSPHPDMSKEVKRLFTLMPRWNPGILNGEVVNCEFSLPVMFNLQ